MRTSILKKQIKELYNNLNVKVEDVTANGNTYKKITNWKTINSVLHILNKYEFIGNAVNDIFDSGANFIASTDITNIIANQYPIFINKLNIVKAKCEAIMNMKTNSFDENEENYLYVKLPDNLKDLDELYSIIKGLNISMNQCPILRDTYKELDFVGVDVGSSWIIVSIILGGAKTLNWIANFIKKCNDIRLQNRTIKKMDLEYIIDKMDLDEKIAEKAVKSAKKNIEADYKEKCLKEFNDIKISSDKKITEEDKVKITHCMLTMIELLESGVEIYPSINSSEELKNAFPKKEEWEKLDNQTKLLDKPVKK